MKSALLIALLLALAAVATADVYMHSPRGSNDRCDEKSNDRNNANRLFDSQNNAAGGYPWAPKMYYHSGSILMFEWHNQHACGANSNTNCELIWQYMCGASVKDGDPDDLTGGTENTCTGTTTVANQDQTNRGRHETADFFTKCNTRQRNTNLFIADQTIQSTRSAQFTRQNPGGTQHGFECHEERDYYPYWHPTEWRDIVVMTSNTSRCSYYTSHSENVEGRNECSNPQFNNEQSCTAGGAQWLYVESHKAKNPLIGLGKPDCVMSPWSRDNHLGSGENGYMNSYNWTIPRVPAADAISCVIRMRYNVSSGDYDPWSTDARSNGANSPVKDDPFVMVGDMPLRMNIDTTQFGRTFEDRSYTFEVRDSYTNSLTANVYNLNVRGKRGNIAQVRNCLEYDFTPQVLHAAVGDFVHFQITGSNHEPAGNAGNGKTSTDRSNFVQMIANDPASNYPEPMTTQSFFKNDATAYLWAHIGQTGCADLATLRAREAAGQDISQQTDNCADLNANMLGYFNGGILRLNRTMNVNYFSTRNNDFTNRSHKGHLKIRAFSRKFLFAMGTVGAIAVVGGAAGSIYYVAKKNGAGFTGFRSTNSFGSRKSGSSGAAAAAPRTSSNRSHGSHRSKSSKSSFGGSMI